MPPLGTRRNPNQQPGSRPPSPMGRLTRGPLLYVIILLILAFVLLNTFASSKTVNDLSLTQYLQKIKSGDVKTAEIFNRDQRVEGKLSDGSSYRVAYPDDYADDLTNALTDAKVPLHVNPQQGNAIRGALVQFLPLLLL